jgi:UDP-N-acetylmuramate--alanine ligase
MQELDRAISEHKRVHFIGAGGIMMSALALELQRQGAYVTGADRSESERVSMLRKAGIPVTIGHFAETVEGASVVVRNAAIHDDSPDIVAARALGIPIIERPTLLGLLMRGYDKRLCFAGTHGKSTTSAMAAQALLTAKKEPTAFLGAVLPEIGGSYTLGKNEFFVAESCEYCDSFLELFPQTAVILNISEDHLDYFSGIEQIISSFRRFALLALNANGVAVVNGEDENVLAAVKGLPGRIVTFGLTKGDYQAADLSFDRGYASFTLLQKGKPLGKITLQIPGRHSVYNALACAAALLENGLSPAETVEGISSFAGVARRFQKLGTYNGAVVIDDYAHHPQELAATLRSAKNMAFERVICLFQPHTYTRTKAFMAEFAKALSLADLALVTDIYAARELPIPGVSANELAKLVPDSLYTPSLTEAAEALKSLAKPGDCILVCGAGNVNEAAYALTNEEKEM